MWQQELAYVPFELLFNKHSLFIDMNMSYRLVFCKTIAQFMSQNNRR